MNQSDCFGSPGRGCSDSASGQQRKPSQYPSFPRKWHVSGNPSERAWIPHPRTTVRDVSCGRGKSACHERARELDAKASTQHSKPRRPRGGGDPSCFRSEVRVRGRRESDHHWGASSDTSQQWSGSPHSRGGRGVYSGQQFACARTTRVLFRTALRMRGRRALLFRTAVRIREDDEEEGLASELAARCLLIRSQALPRHRARCPVAPRLAELF